MRIALAQLDPTVADFAAIEARILAAHQQAQAEKAELLVFPELATIGYPPRDLLDRASVVAEQWQLVERLSLRLTIPTILGAVEGGAGQNHGRLANAAIVLQNGTIDCCYRKRLLPSYDVFDEHRYFAAGKHSLIVEIAGQRLGITICEDIWTEAELGFAYDDDPVGDLIDECDVLINIAASPYHVGKPSQRWRLLQDLARDTNVPVVYVNQVGGQDELLFDGRSAVVLPNGNLAGCLPAWQEAVAVIDTTSDGQPLSELFPDQSDSDSDQAMLTDLYHALVHGIKSYCDKTFQSRVVLGLSGGIDSAVVATLAVDALGADNVTGILMPGPYSSQGSIDDAEALASHLGIETFTCGIGAANDALLESLSEVFSGTEANVAEENIQARLRGVMVMAYANKHNAMALTTGNKSELAVGYCTIYGDMNGGLAPIGDVYKTTVFDLARWLNRDGERIPENTITKPPSAELRPDQVDADSLPPYDVLDRILQNFLEADRHPDHQIASGEDPETVARIIRLVEVNEYKRRQSAPVIRVSPKAFGVGRRVPLARKI